MADDAEDKAYVPPTVSEFKAKVDGYQDEIWCNGTRTSSHTYPSQVLFSDTEGNNFRLVDDNPQRHMGCGCWTGIEFKLEQVEDDSLDLRALRRVVAALKTRLDRANKWAAENGRVPEWVNGLTREQRAAAREERVAAAPLKDVERAGVMLSELLEGDIHGLIIPKTPKQQS